MDTLLLKSAKGLNDEVESLSSECVWLLTLWSTSTQIDTSEKKKFRVGRRDEGDCAKRCEEWGRGKHECLRHP